MSSPSDQVLRHLRREARDGEISVWMVDPLLRDAGIQSEDLLSQATIELVTTLIVDDGLVVFSLGRGVRPWKRKGHAAVRALIGLGLGNRKRVPSGICLIRPELL